jgi:hypothetical protein
MANIDQTEATNMLKSMLNGTAYTVPPGWFLALNTATTPPTATVLGSEVTAGGNAYSRQSCTFGTAAAGAAATTNAQTFTNMPAATVPTIEIYTTSTLTTRRLWYGSLTAGKTTAAGDTLTFAIGAITASLG